MNQNFQCLNYKGKGNSLIKLKEQTKDTFKSFDSFVRISTCQRIEIYSEKNLSPLENMNKLDFPNSMIHLVEVLSGVDSGLFGEIEVYLQIKESVKTAKKEKHLSPELEKLFNQAFEISDNIREKFELNNSWINSIEEKISKLKDIFIFGDGNLAKALENNLSPKGFSFLNNPKSAEAIIILKKGFKSSNKNARIINLTEEEFKEDEINMSKFFTKTDKKLINSIKDEIKKELDSFSKKDKLEVDKYPKIYQDYLEKEKQLAIEFSKDAKNLLDVGCGTGRIIPLIQKSVKKYTGIDINDKYLKVAKQKWFSNVEILNINAEVLSKKFKTNQFDKTICLWNTIGCLANDKKVISEISKVTKGKFFFTVLAKGTLEKRKEYYENFGIDYHIDEKNEIIHSKEWGTSKAYSKEDIKDLISNTNFKVSNIKLIENFAYAVYLEN